MPPCAEHPPFSRPPVGFILGQTARVVARAFDEALSRAGGSLPVWLILLTLKMRRADTQKELADAIGIQGATLTHHLDAMEQAGLVSRRRDPRNRRAHLVEMTAEGDTKFESLRTEALAFDRQLRQGLSEEDVAALERILGLMRENATGAGSLETEFL